MITTTLKALAYTFKYIIGRQSLSFENIQRGGKHTTDHSYVEKPEKPTCFVSHLALRLYHSNSTTEIIQKRYKNTKYWSLRLHEKFGTVLKILICIDAEN